MSLSVSDLFVFDIAIFDHAKLPRVVVKLGNPADQDPQGSSADSLAITVYKGLSESKEIDIGVKIDTIIAASEAGDHYGVLGISKPCSSQGVGSAFRAMSKWCHPDKSIVSSKKFVLIPCFALQSSL